MAEIWPVYEGREPTRGGPWAKLPFSQVIELLDLAPEDFVSEPAQTPRFGRTDRDLTVFGFKHIVVEIGPKEAVEQKWKPGFYRSPLQPGEAFNRLLRHALAQELGENNVLRVEHAYATDSEGRPSYSVTVVLAPEATNRITGDAAIGAFGRLQNLFTAMGIEGTPVLQYATEAELAQIEV